MSTELEFVVVEGQAKGEVFALRADQVELGRRDPSTKQDPPSRISFPDATVSSVHALLNWDAKRNRYLLTHRSSTNHTLVNGKVVQGNQYIHVGDKIKMGTLVVQLRLIPKQPLSPQVEPPAPPPTRSVGGLPVAEPASPGQVSYQLLILNGPDAGRLHPVQQETLILQEPGSQQTYEPTLNIQGAGATRCLLLFKPPDIHVTCAESGNRPVLIDQPLGGIVRQRNPGPEFGNLLTSQSLLLIGKIALLVVPGAQANEQRGRLLAGEQVSPLQAGLFHEGDRIWNRGEQHLLRFMTGPLKGTHFWIDHRKMERSISIGRIGQRTLVELTDRGVPSCEVFYADDGMQVRNVDTELSLPVNHEELASSQTRELQSGDTLRLGRTLIRYEYTPLQQRIDTYSLFWEGREYPLRRAVNLVGNSAQCDIRIDDERLGALVGRIVVSETSLRYQHRQAGLIAHVQGQELQPGQEASLRLDHEVMLCPGVELRLGRRSASFDDAVEG